MTQKSNPIVSTRTAIMQDGDKYYMHLIWCPGCDEVHAPASRHPETFAEHVGPLWDYNNNPECPTFEPSILVYLGTEQEPKNCHSFVRNGQWQFLDDSWHSLKGQTVDMVSLPDWLVKD